MKCCPVEQLDYHLDETWWSLAFKDFKLDGHQFWELLIGTVVGVAFEVGNSRHSLALVVEDKFASLDDVRNGWWMIYWMYFGELIF